jgi:hypothetical protein
VITRAAARMLTVLLAGLMALGALLPASASALSWAIVPSPSVNGDDNFLSALSCASAAFCEAVGALTAKGVTSSLIDSWNGKSWATATTPKTGGQLDAVSCASATACMAVGFTGISPLAERWNGTRWSMAPTPAEPSGELVGVSCSSVAACTAVGVDSNGPLIESWNGTRWSVVPSPRKPNGLLDAVSCVSPALCTTVGENGLSPSEPLIESWNGTRWSVVPSPRKPDGNLSGVSCVSAASCTAVGTYLAPGAIGKPLAESWNGTRWTITPIPTPKPDDFELNGVSCVSATRCTAAGSYLPDPASQLRTLIESWDGTRWSKVASPSPTPKAYVLFGVSCPSARTCTAAGIVTPASGELSRTVIETGTAAAAPSRR